MKDVVVDRPRLLLVGINPGLRSGALGHHFAGRGNPFWRLLAAARLTPVLLDYPDDRRLAEFGIALTNLCPRTTRTAAELTRAEIARGRGALARKIARWRPAVVAFVGVSLYAMYFSRSAPQARRATVAADGDFRDRSCAAMNRSVVFSGSRTPALRAGAAGGRGTRGGPGAKPETISGARVFVVPNPSGLNASYPGFAHKLVWFERLRRFMNRV